MPSRPGPGTEAKALYWAENAERFDRAVASYHERFVAAAEIGRTERVLDIGCGTGQTTRDAARAAPDGTALGVDLSGPMIALARRLAGEQGVANATFEQTDAQVHPFPEQSFDVAISRTGTMFFGDQVAAFANIARAIRPGGRLSVLVWQGPEPNEWIRDLSKALPQDVICPHHRSVPLVPSPKQTPMGSDLC